MHSTPKRICLLGSTGSIGEKTLQVVRDFPERFKITGLSANRSARRLAEQADEFHPTSACLSGNGDLPAANGATRWFTGDQGLIDLIHASEPDIVVVALVGAAGLAPTIEALERGITVALANKEVLVTAGRLVMELARRREVSILPIDSEHNAIFQCLCGRDGDEVRRIILTGSGGPFRGWTREDLQRATLEQALKHPTWAMGPKITVDSATLMNKGFEVIEGHHLFNLPVDLFKVVIHPQSVVHSMVEFVDGSLLAQLGVTDMYFPIINTLSYPERLANSHFEPLDLTAVGSLKFEDYDPDTFPCLGYAREAARRGETYPAVLNAANEVAVERFLAGDIRFLDIPEVIDAVLQAHRSCASPGFGEIREADAWGRSRARSASFSHT